MYRFRYYDNTYAHASPYVLEVNTIYTVDSVYHSETTLAKYEAVNYCTCHIFRRYIIESDYVMTDIHS